MALPTRLKTLTSVKAGNMAGFRHLEKSLKIHLAWVGVAVVMLERLQLRVAEVRRHHVLRGHRHAEDAPGLGSAAAGGAAATRGNGGGTAAAMAPAPADGPKPGRSKRSSR